MAEIMFNNGKFSIDKPLYQWDKNITLKIKGLSLPSTPEIHFSNSAMGGAIVKTATVEDGVVVVTIPNGLLQVINNLKVYVCFYQGEEFTTNYKFILEITPREKPGDYSLQDDEDVYSFNELKALVESYKDQVDGKIQGAKTQIDTDFTVRLNTQRSEIDSEIHRVEAKANANYKTVNERVNNLVATDPGSTGDNAELLDIRVGYDGTTYPTAGDAVRGQIGEVKSDLSDIGDTLRFEYVPILPTEYYTFPNTGKALADNGNIYDVSNHDTSDYIELKGLYGICRVVSSTAKYNLSRLAFYDKDKNFLKFVTPGTNYEFDTFNGKTVVWLPLEESAIYVRFDGENTRGFNYWIVYKEPEAKIFDEYCLINDFNNFVESVVYDVEGNNILNPSLLKNDGYHYDFNDGITKITNSYGLITEDFIEVPYKELVIIKDFDSEFDTNIIAFYFYDSDGNYINYTTTRYSTFVDNKWVVKLPTNSTKVKVYTNNKNIDTSKLCISHTKIDKFEPYTLHKKLKEDLLPKGKEFYPLKDKVIVNFGDSIIGNKRPPTDISTKLAEITGATVYNLGFGGCRMSQHDSNWDAFSMYRIADAIATNDFSIQDAVDVSSVSGMPSYFIETRTLLESINFNDVDIITIAYGTNDFTANVNLDSDSNIYDTTTFAGALRYSIEKLLGKYPHLKIFLCGQTYKFWMDSEGVFTDDSDTRTNTNGVKLIDFVEKTRDVSKDYHLKFIDNYYELGINKFNRNHWFPSNDGTHHNELGGKLIAEHMANELY